MASDPLTRGQAVVLKKAALIGEVMRLQDEVAKFRGAAEFALERVVGSKRENEQFRRLVQWLARQPCTYGIDNSPCRLNSGADPNEYCVPHACQTYLETGEWPASFAAQLRGDDDGE